MASRYEMSCVTAPGSLMDAMRSLESSRTQIVLLTDASRRLLGTLTDGDIRRALLAGAGLDSPLPPYVHRDFVAVGPDLGRTDVLDLMNARSVNQIPIVDKQGQLVGLHLLKEILGAEERPNWAVLMAGGKGTRLLPLTESLPKPMIHVAGRPILERLVLHLVGYGIRRIFLSVNYLSEMIEGHFGDGTKYGCKIEYLRESRPLGTGGALSLLPEVPQHPILALNGDLVVQFDLPRLLAFHTREKNAITVGIHSYAHTVPFGVVEVAGNRVTDLREKPTTVWRTNAGIYVIEPPLLERVPRDTEFPLPGLIEQCLARQEPVGALDIEGDWIDVGRTTELDRARGQSR